MLVNNAGILPEATDTATPEFASVEMFERTYRTNVFGPVAVTEAFLPLLRRSTAGRIVNVSTTMGSLSSKAALNGVTIAMAKKLADARSRSRPCVPASSGPT